MVGCSKPVNKNSSIGRKDEISEKIKSSNTYRDPTSFKLLSMKESYKVDCYETYVVSYTYGQGFRFYNLVIYTNGKYCDMMDWDSDDTSLVYIVIDSLRDNKNDPDILYPCFCE